MNINVRPVTVSEVDAVVDLLNSIIDDGRYSIMTTPETRETQIAFLDRLPARSVYHAAIDSDSGSLIGVQDVTPVYEELPALAHVGEISTFVAPGHHRLGAGGALMKATVEAAAAHGFRKLCAMIRGDNPGAVAYYRSQGFQIVGTLREHAKIGDRYVDEIMTERAIS